MKKFRQLLTKRNQQGDGSSTPLALPNRSLPPPPQSGRSSAPFAVPNRSLPAPPQSGRSTVPFAPPNRSLPAPTESTRLSDAVVDKPNKSLPPLPPPSQRFSGAVQLDTTSPSAPPPPPPPLDTVSEGSDGSPPQVKPNGLDRASVPLPPPSLSSSLPYDFNSQPIVDDESVSPFAPKPSIADTDGSLSGTSSMGETSPQSDFDGDNPFPSASNLMDQQSDGESEASRKSDASGSQRGGAALPPLRPPSGPLPMNGENSSAARQAVPSMMPPPGPPPAMTSPQVDMLPSPPGPPPGPPPMDNEDAASRGPVPSMPPPPGLPPGTPTSARAAYDAGSRGAAPSMPPPSTPPPVAQNNNALEVAASSGSMESTSTTGSVASMSSGYSATSSHADSISSRTSSSSGGGAADSGVGANAVMAHGSVPLAPPSQLERGSVPLAPPSQLERGSVPLAPPSQLERGSVPLAPPSHPNKSPPPLPPPSVAPPTSVRKSKMLTWLNSALSIPPPPPPRRPGQLSLVREDDFLQASGQDVEEDDESLWEGYQVELGMDNADKGSIVRSDSGSAVGSDSGSAVGSDSGSAVGSGSGGTVSDNARMTQVTNFVTPPPPPPPRHKSNKYDAHYSKSNMVLRDLVRSRFSFKRKNVEQAQQEQVSDAYTENDEIVADSVSESTGDDSGDLDLWVDDGEDASETFGRAAPPQKYPKSVRRAPEFSTMRRQIQEKVGPQEAPRPNRFYMMSIAPRDRDNLARKFGAIRNHFSIKSKGEGHSFAEWKLERERERMEMEQGAYNQPQQPAVENRPRVRVKSSGKGTWKSTIDPVSGDKYYYNKVRGIASWDKPANLVRVTRKKKNYTPVSRTNITSEQITEYL